MKSAKRQYVVCLVLLLVGAFISLTHQPYFTSKATPSQLPEKLGATVPHLVNNINVKELKSTFFIKYGEFEPEDVSTLGDQNSLGKLKDLSQTSIGEQQQFYRSILLKIGVAKERSLGGSEKLDIDAIERLAKYKLHLIESKMYLQNIWESPLPAKLIANQLMQAEKEKDYTYIAQRLECIPTFLKQQENNLLRGQQIGKTPNKYEFDQVIETLTGISGEGGESALFTNKLISKAEVDLKSSESGTLNRLRQAAVKAQDAITQHIKFLKSEIGPSAEKNLDIAIGNAEYKWRLDNVFNLQLTPEKMQEIADKELQIIRQHMEVIASNLLGRKIRGSDALRKAMTEIRSSYSVIEPSKAIDTYRQLSNKAQDFAVKRKLINVPVNFQFEVVELSKGAMSGSAPGTNIPARLLDPNSKGYFVVNLEEKHFMQSAPVLAVHEAIPGHYLQSAFYQHLYASDPSPVRFLQVDDEINVASGYWGTMPVIEGWALYSERVMLEQGYYSTPQEQLEAYAALALRATRVLVDTMLHAQNKSINEVTEVLYTKGLTQTREKARRDIIKRYSVMPMQAFTYFIGDLQIRGLREKWLRSHPNKSMADFHEQFFSYGPLPIETIAKVMLK